VQIAVVGDRQRGLLELLGAANQVVYAIGAVEEGVLRVTVEMDERHAEKATPRPEWQGGGDRFARLLYWWRKRGVKWLWRTTLALFVVLVLFLSLVPMGRYLARAGWEEGKILWRRREIEEMISDSSVAPAVRSKLALVLDARAFAAADLRLDAGESFTTFSQLDSDTLVLVLSAAYRDKLAHHRWWFPIVGHVPYKGFFDERDAKREEADFQRRGFDTYLRPASAFSTLGWFNDPVVSASLRADTLSLANTVIHELTHNTFYASGQAEFNESFANFVGARGSAEFYRTRGQARVVAEAEARWSDDKVLAAFWKKLHRDIDSSFKAHPGDAERELRVALRDSIYRAARQELIFRVGPQLRTVAPRYVERVRLDNAALLARRIYLTDVALFDSVWVREGRDVKRTVQRVIALARGEREPYEAVRRWVVANPVKR
jgi:predicted aminopeptidase